jgi:hypothetical protein
MGTREPVFLDSSGNFPFLPLLLLVFSGIIGISFWLAWMFFKSKNRGRDDRIYVSSAPLPAATAPAAESYLLAMRRGESGEWEIYVNDVRYRALETVPGESVRREVVAGMKELVTFARSYLQKESAAGPSAAATAPAEPVAMPSTRPEKMAPPAPKPAPPAVKPTAPPEATGGRPRLRLSNEPELKRTATPAQFMPTLDLAKDIGDIVEEMQKRAPALRDRSIRLRNAASGGVEFTVDGLVYASVDEIPEADIQALIRAAIKEWERR